MSDFSELIRNIRIAHGDRLLDTARKLDTSAAVVSRMERGWHEVSGKLVARFIAAYGLGENADNIVTIAHEHNTDVQASYPTDREVARLTPSSIQQYLASNGWENLGFYSLNSLYYEHPDRGGIIVPDDRNCADYPRIVSEILRLLSLQNNSTVRRVYQAILDTTPKTEAPHEQ